MAQPKLPWGMFGAVAVVALAVAWWVMGVSADVSPGDARRALAAPTPRVDAARASRPGRGEAVSGAAVGAPVAGPTDAAARPPGLPVPLEVELEEEADRSVRAHLAQAAPRARAIVDQLAEVHVLDDAARARVDTTLDAMTARLDAVSARLEAGEIDGLQALEEIQVVQATAHREVRQAFGRTPGVGLLKAFAPPGISMDLEELERLEAELEVPDGGPPSGATPP